MIRLRCDGGGPIYREYGSRLSPHHDLIGAALTVVAAASLPAERQQQSVLRWVESGGWPDDTSPPTGGTQDVLHDGAVGLVRWAPPAERRGRWRRKMGARHLSEVLY